MTATTIARPKKVRPSEPPLEPAAPSSRALSGDGRLSGWSSPGPLTVARAATGSIRTTARAVAAAVRERFTPPYSDERPVALGRLGLQLRRGRGRRGVDRRPGPRDVGHAQAELLVDHDDLAAGDDAPVDEQVDRLAGHTVQADDRARAEGQGLAEGHRGATDLDRHLDGDVGQALELA